MYDLYDVGFDFVSLYFASSVWTAGTFTVSNNYFNVTFIFFLPLKKIRHKTGGSSYSKWRRRARDRPVGREMFLEEV